MDNGIYLPCSYFNIKGTNIQVEKYRFSVPEAEFMQDIA